MKQLSIYFVILLFVSPDFTVARHNRKGKCRKLHPCPVPGGRNGVCVSSDMCSEPANNYFRPHPRNNHFCRLRRRYEEPMICCLRIYNQNTDEVPIDDIAVEMTTRIQDLIPLGEQIEDVDKVIEQKCAEYTKVAMDVEAQIETGGPPRVFQPFVVGGTNSLAREFPHMALLGFGNEDSIEWKCGGSLISDNFVLTAAHCLHTPSAGDVNFVRLGDLSISSDTDDAKPQQFKIVQRYSHPDYDSGESRYNDIALLQLDQRVTFTKYVRPACIDISDNRTSPLIATGWGTTEYGGPTSDSLQKVDLVYYSYEQCGQAFGPQSLLVNGVDENSQLCAGGADGEEKDTCQGDSGSPLQVVLYDSPRMYKIVGVTSFGKACGLPNTPGVYSKVSYFSPWIVDIVWPDN